MWIRWLGATVILVGCYDRTAATSCTLTCDQATPCPGDMLCGDDRLCRAPGAASCNPLVVDGPNVLDTAPDALLDSCPASYDITLPSTLGTSRYRAITARNFFWTHELTCRNDVAGLTHMVVTETVAELEDVVQRIGTADASLACWVGAVQDPAAASPGAGWIRLDGVAVDLAQWRGGEPDDGGNGEGDHGFNAAGFRCDTTVPRLIDVLGQEDGITLCECDGKAVSPTAIAHMANDPNHL